MSEWNFRPRELYCPKCKTIVVNTLPAPRCEECNSKLITVVYDILSGQRITGNDELVR